MFIGRERELEALNKLYNSNKFEFAVIYGRKRVGKTALINEFIGDIKKDDCVHCDGITIAFFVSNNIAENNYFT